MKRTSLLLLLLITTFIAYAQKEKEPNLKKIYFTNMAGEKITGSVTAADKMVYMVIESTNAIGEKVVLTMDEDEEYFYKNKFLGGGSSIKIRIKEDTQKVKLIIYNARIKKHVKRRMKAEGAAKAADATK